MERDAKVFDEITQLKDAGLIAVDDICQVDGSDAIVDLGDGHVEADIVIEASAVEADTGDEIYNIGLQFSNSSTFASGIVQGIMFPYGDAVPIGALFTAGGADTDTVEGRQVIPFNNTFNGVHYRYCRFAIEVTGTVLTGMNFIAYISKD